MQQKFAVLHSTLEPLIAENSIRRFSVLEQGPPAHAAKAVLLCTLEPSS